eukprot:366354-Chlamydomonas_euryale.AAC.5
MPALGNAMQRKISRTFSRLGSRLGSALVLGPCPRSTNVLPHPLCSPTQSVWGRESAAQPGDDARAVISDRSRCTSSIAIDRTTRPSRPAPRRRGPAHGDGRALAARIDVAFWSLRAGARRGARQPKRRARADPRATATAATFGCAVIGSDGVGARRRPEGRARQVRRHGAFGTRRVERNMKAVGGGGGLVALPPIASRQHADDDCLHAYVFT